MGGKRTAIPLHLKLGVRFTFSVAAWGMRQRSDLTAWQHGATLRLARLEGRITDSEKYPTDVSYRPTVDRNRT